MRILKRRKRKPWPQGRLVGPSGVHGQTFHDVIEAVARWAEGQALKWVDPDTAADIAQQLRVDLYEKWSEDPTFLDGRPPSKQYVRRYVFNKVVTLWRRAGRAEAVHQTFELLREADTDDADDVSLKERQDALTVATLKDRLKAMPPKRRKAFVMARIEGMPYREVAKKTRRSVSAVRQLVVEANKDLREEAVRRGLVPTFRGRIAPLPEPEPQ